MKLATYDSSGAASGLELFRYVPPGVEGSPRCQCAACGDHIWSSGAYRVPGLAGLYCGMPCIETGLFSLNHCRWCGREMEKPYTSVESRLCSEDCGANYFAHVLGDGAARLGSGKRFLLWLQRKQPATYREIVSSATLEGFCKNPRCPNGENGQPASLVHLRAGTKYCCDACRVQAQRSPDRQKSPSKTPVFIEDSRNSSRRKTFPLKLPKKRGWRNTSAFRG